MSDKTEAPGWLSLAVSTALQAISIILDHQSQVLGAWAALYRSIAPYLQLFLGICMGYGWCRWRLGRELSEVRGEIMAKAEREDVDIRLDRLNEIIATKADASRVDEVRANSVTHKDLEEAIASALVDVARHYEGEGLISDTSIKLAIQDGRITGFDRDVLENAIGTDHQTRSWLERAVENGYVDVLGQEVEAHDHQGHFRSLVDEDESHAGRYVPRDGVRDVLRRYPEAFDAASDYEAQLKSWVEKSKKVSDDDIKYRKVKRDI